MQNTLISTGAVIGIVLGGYAASTMFGNDPTEISAFVGAMIGAAAGGWIAARIVDRVG